MEKLIQLIKIFPQAHKIGEKLLLIGFIFNKKLINLKEDRIFVSKFVLFDFKKIAGFQLRFSVCFFVDPRKFYLHEVELKVFLLIETV